MVDVVGGSNAVVMSGYIDVSVGVEVEDVFLVSIVGKLVGTVSSGVVIMGIVEVVDNGSVEVVGSS